MPVRLLPLFPSSALDLSADYFLSLATGSLAAKTAGIGLGGPITSHPSVRADLEKHYQYSEDRVVVAGNLVTSRGPGTAIEWALKIVEILAGKEKRDEVAGPMMI